MVNKSTGPVSAQGKAWSAQNASKHKIFVGRILTDEKKQASLLFSAFQQELPSQGALETEIVADIVLNRLQKRRIDKYVANEFEKASMRNLVTGLERYDRNMALYWRRRVDSGRGFSGPFGERLPPGCCVAILDSIKSNIERVGLLPANDLEVLNLVYGNQLTEHGALMVSEYKEVLQMDLAQCTEDDKGRKSRRAEYQRSILESLNTEIDRQRTQCGLKTELDQMEYASGVPAPPPAPILDQILRYSAANMREFKQLLDALKRIRELKDNT